MTREDRSKVCGRCGHTWNSHAETPVRCPGCGTYHWQGEPTVNTCAVCGHKWFSRGTKSPLRCPSCKTRSWMTGQRRHGIPASAQGVDREYLDVMGRYESGSGCITISIETDLPLSRVIDIVKSGTAVGHVLRM